MAVSRRGDRSTGFAELTPAVKNWQRLRFKTINGFVDFSNGAVAS
jgi:hypothetical protein